MWSLAFAPFFILPAAYISFALPCLWVAFEPRETQKAAKIPLLVFAWAFCANITSLYWITYAVYLSFGQSLLGAGVAAIALLLFCCYLSLFPLGAFFAQRLLLRRTSSESATLRIGTFVCTFVLAESLRSVLLGGFPWNLAGYAWNISIMMLQVNALGGIALTSLLALCSYAIAALAAYYLLARGTRRGIRKDIRKNIHKAYIHKACIHKACIHKACLCAVLSLAIPASATAFGAWRLQSAPELDKSSPIVRIVQPNIQQDKKWREQDAIDNFRRAVQLSKTQRADSISLLLWPETSFPYRLKTEDEANGQPLVHPRIPQLIAIVPHWMVFGAVRESKRRDAKGYRNSLVMIDNFGRINGLYDKVRLVPFGESIPFSRYFLGNTIQTLTNFPSFESGGENSNLLKASPALTLSVQICYEAIFSESLPFSRLRKNHKRKDYSRDQADLLFNATNDGWFGRSSGPYQHLQIARVRAVERGIPFFRAANTGISAAFDAFGQEIARLPLGIEGWIDAPLAPKTKHLLLLDKVGNSLFWLLWASVSLTLILMRRKL